MQWSTHRIRGGGDGGRYQVNKEDFQTLLCRAGSWPAWIAGRGTDFIPTYKPPPHPHQAIPISQAAQITVQL